MCSWSVFMVGNCDWVHLLRPPLKYSRLKFVCILYWTSIMINSDRYDHCQLPFPVSADVGRCRRLCSQTFDDCGGAYSLKNLRYKLTFQLPRTILNFRRSQSGHHQLMLCFLWRQPRAKNDKRCFSVNSIVPSMVTITSAKLPRR